LSKEMDMETTKEMLECYVADARTFYDEKMLQFGEASLLSTAPRYIEVAAIDDPEYDMSKHFDGVLAEIQNQLDLLATKRPVEGEETTKKLRVFFHCRQGVNRSGAVLAAALWKFAETEIPESCTGKQWDPKSSRSSECLDRARKALEPKELKKPDHVVDLIRAKRRPRYAGMFALRNEAFVCQFKKWAAENPR